MLYKDPVKWAKEASEKGFTHALGITNSCKCQFFVTVGGVIPNKTSVFWTIAHNWLLKRAPASVLESLKQKQEADKQNPPAAT